MSGLLWSTDRPEFVERVAALAGGTTYRLPVAGRGTKADQLPDAHAVAAALAYARTSPGDIGPDVAYCWALQTDVYRDRVLRQALAMLPGKGRSAKVEGELMQALGAAWDAMIWDRPTRRPADIPERAWSVALLFGIKVLHESAWDAVAAAERAYRRGVA